LCWNNQLETASLGITKPSLVSKRESQTNAATNLGVCFAMV